MYEPHRGERDRHDRSGAVTPIEHYACSLAGFVVAVATGAIAYPLLIGATESLHLLSSTAIAFALLLLWFLAWLSIEIAWEWRAGRVAVGR